MSDNYYKALGEVVKLTHGNTSLREELATSNKVGTAIGETLGRVTAERDDLHKRLTAAEQRNAELVELLRRVQPCISKYTNGTKSPLRAKIDDALKPTESGASYTASRIDQ